MAWCDLDFQFFLLGPKGECNVHFRSLSGRHIGFRILVLSEARGNGIVGSARTSFTVRDFFYHLVSIEHR